MTTAPVAIPQTYKGVRFRSTLEANWARTLDTWTIAWSYEPEAFSLPSGASYLPDFYLPQLSTWLEVKGPGVGGIEKFREFAATKVAPIRVPEGMSPSDELFVIGYAQIGLQPRFDILCRWCDELIAGDHERAFVGMCRGYRFVQFATYCEDGCCMESRCMADPYGGDKVDRVNPSQLPFVVRQWQPKRKAGARR